MFKELSRHKFTLIFSISHNCTPHSGVSVHDFEECLCVFYSLKKYTFPKSIISQEKILPTKLEFTNR